MPNLKRFIRNGNYFYFKDAPIHISGVSLDKKAISLTEVGQTEQLTATVSPSSAVDDPSVTWSSSDTSVATVSNTGLVTCVTPGDCTITVTTNYGGFTDTCTVTNFVPVDQLFGYTGAEQSILLQPATYCLEVWGAEGGYSPYGGKGGYSRGRITLNTATCVYIYVGGMGCYGCGAAGGWNGGGISGTYSTSNAAGGGGGGTDIRIGGNTLCHRRIVAGGGGGGGHNHSYDYGGAGGGLCGVKGCGTSSTTTYYTIQATQIDGAGFGIGSGGYAGTTGGGGGGGWYGGGGTCWEGGSGGSGYVYNSLTCQNAPSCYCHCTAYFLTNTATCCGLDSFPSPSGSTETGHCGCGCARIRSI